MAVGSGKVYWHQRFGPVRCVRRHLRDGLFAFLRKALATDDGKAAVAASLEGLLNGQRPSVNGQGNMVCPTYPELGRTPLGCLTSQRNDIILITGRFRSGSTLLWNLFRHVEGVTSYYEPLNERRWFDPALRGDRTDATHLHVSDYWKEYDGLQVLGDYYREEWIGRNLCMGPDAWDPDLKRYVEILVERAPGRPALQFNRIDFRLPWFRRNFPNAKIVHLYRHPRDQWCSSLMDVRCFPCDGKMSDFAAHDKFYLLTWAADLKYQFPFLNPAGVRHPYELFYYIWKLSYLYGRRYAHYSLAFEDLVADPETRLCELFRVAGVRQFDVGKLKDLVARPALGKWKEYAEDEWFRRQEEVCETVLAEFFARVSL